MKHKIDLVLKNPEAVADILTCFSQFEGAIEAETFERHKVLIRMFKDG